MIKELEILNFQSHEESHLEFDKGVNVIVGRSDSGKTSIIRALRWVFWNRPSGDSYRSHWGGDTEVTVTTSENKVITKHKSKKENAYFMDGKKFTAFGQDVPEEIKVAGNITEVNLQQQLDAPFLISESPGSVAQHFNKVAKLDKIDKGLSYVNSKIKSINNDIKYAEENLSALEDDLNEFDNLDIIERDLERLESLNKRKERVAHQIGDLGIHIDELQDVDLQIQENENNAKGEKDIDEILELYRERSDIDTSGKGLKLDIEKIENVGIREADYSHIIKAEKDIDSILSLHKKVVNIEEDMDSLIEIIDDLDTIDTRLQYRGQKIAKMQEEFDKMFPDVCPLCGNETK